MKTPDFDKPVKQAEDRYLQSLHDDMLTKQRRWESCGNFKKEQYAKEFKSAQLVYWKELERLSYGFDHEEEYYHMLRTVALSLLDTEEIDMSNVWPPHFWDPDRDDNDWMLE